MTPWERLWPREWRPGRRPPGSRRGPMTETQRFLLLSILIGLFAGLVVVCFHIAIERLAWAALGTPPASRRAAALLSPLLGAGLSGLLVLFVFRTAAGSGVNHTKSAIYISDGYIPPGAVAGKFLACSVSIGSGNPLGPEDPALQMGAGLASFLGRAFRLTRDHMRHIAPVGAAAGLAAAFNTPITAVLFVIEEVVAGWNAGVLGSIVLAAVSAVVVTRSFLGDQPLFRVPDFTLTHPSELLVYAGIGVLGGLLGAIHARTLTRLRGRMLAMPRAARLVQPFAAGLIVGVCGLAVPEILGAGYATIDGALHGEFDWPQLFAFAVLKAALVALAFASGTPGGLFAPTLFVGAMLGGGAGALAHTFWPVPTSETSAYVLVGMGTFFAAVFRTPMTSIFMVFEVSATYAIIAPVMIANTLAYLVSRALQHQGVFDIVAQQDGTPLPSPEHQRQQTPLRVEDAMEPCDGLTVLDPLTPVVEAAERAEEGDWPAVLVAQPPRGWIPVARDVLAAQQRADGLVPVGALVRDQPARSLHPDEGMEAALGMLAVQPLVPVVTRARPPRLLGVLTVRSVLDAYARRGRAAGGSEAS
jgi:CIC family chloride channel protein